MRRLLLTFAMLAASAATVHAAPAHAAGSSGDGPLDCGALATMSFADTAVTSATMVSGQRFDYPDSLFNALAGDHAYTENVSFCRVVGTIEGTIGFELWLPKYWNGKFQAVGNGGYTGAINYPAMGAALQRGYATASTDTGHKSKDMFDVSWMDGYNQDLMNFGYRSQHLTALRAKDIMVAFYGHGPRYSYFNGCSTGGWQGLTEAQKFPDDYDGVIAGAPAHDFVRLQANILILAQLRAEHPEGNLSDADRRMLADAAVAKCDPQDGVTDGLISHPLQCDFDPAELQCGREGEGNCLSAAQVERARFLYGERTTDRGLRLYPGPAWGTVTRSSEPQPVDETGLVKALDAAPDWDFRTFDPDRDIPELEEKMLDDLSAMNPDLRIFYSNGSKLIVYHGTLDPGISPYHTLQYREMVERALGSGITRSFYRIFLVPGMGHCRGGPGPDEFDMVTALEDWVEKGKAPERIVAVKRSNGRVTRSRPLCAFPQIAVYNGDGSTDSAENFTCQMPSRRRAQ